MVALLALGCAGGKAQPDPNAALLLTAEHAVVQLAPGQIGTVTFLLTSQGAPAAGRNVSFSIPDPSQANGTSLHGGVTSAVTNGAGIAAVEVQAGLENAAGVHIHAVSGTASADARVVVATGGTGSVAVAPFFVPGSRATTTAANVVVDFYPAVRCEDIDPGSPPAPALPSISLPVDGGAARFDVISTSAPLNAARIIARVYPIFIRMPVP